MRQVAILIVFAAALFGLLIYSQLRPTSNHVSGIIEADEIRVGSRVGGRVESVFIAEGDKVTKGTRLVQFEPFDIVEREKQAAAELAQREAALAKMRAGLRPEEVAQAKAGFDLATAEQSLIAEGPRPEEIEAAENRLVAAKAVLNLARQERDRGNELYTNKAISKSEHDRVNEAFTEASANVQIRENELAILKAGSRKQELDQAIARQTQARLTWELAKQGYRKEEVAQAVAARDAASAALDAINQQQNELTLSSPADGYVDSLDLQPGDLVGPNAPVMTILSLQTVWVRAYVPQRFMQLRLGQRMKVQVDAFPNQTLDGTITFISNQAEFTPGNVQTPDDRAKLVYRIRVTIDDKERLLRPGMTANVSLEPLDTDQ